MEKLISIVIPTFNRKDYLKTTLEAFKNQCFTDFEVIIADDGSSDGTKEMVSSLELPFPVKYCRQKNAGRSAARNMGARLAQSAIILFVDDHIIPSPQLIEQHLAFHCRYQSLKLGAVRGHMEFIDRPKDAPKNPVKISFLTNLKLRLGEQDPLKFHTGNVSVIKEAFIKAGGFDESIKEYGFEDQELGYRLKIAGYKIKFNPDAVGYIFKIPCLPEKEYDKARQAGHCAVLCYKKFPWFGIRAGANFVNLLLYRLLSLNNNWWLRQAEQKLSLAKRNEATKYREQIKCFYFLSGVREGFNR